MTLSEIQKKLKVPKSEYNSFGKYKYRTAEGILEAVKKILPKECNLWINDDILEIGGRIYIRSEVNLMWKDHHFASPAPTSW